MSLPRKPGDVVTIMDFTDRGRFVSFACPGCGENHCLPVEDVRGRYCWLWNGSTDRPTLEPSILMKTTRLTKLGYEQLQTIADGAGGFDACKTLDREDVVCHSFVRDGRIEFLGDCTHSLADQTIPLPPIDRD